MNIKTELSVLFLGLALTACQTTTQNTNLSAANTNSNGASSPTAAATPRTFSATQLLSNFRTNESATNDLLRNSEIMVSGGVVEAENGTVALSDGTKDQIRCSGDFMGTEQYPKFELLGKAVQNNLSGSGSKPQARVKGIYRSGSGSQSGGFTILLEKCQILEVPK